MTRIVAMTGATGFVGAETLDQLAEAGFEIRALVRGRRQGDMNVAVSGAGCPR